MDSARRERALEHAKLYEKPDDRNFTYSGPQERMMNVERSETVAPGKNQLLMETKSTVIKEYHRA
jgi:hypothetical protein